ncbi:MAG: hypothetical protein CMB56_003830 [Methanobacteriota archaeon]|nr:MAG: hypothetical protein CMB56_003830 [Euryarchaeota archaeon]
MRVKKIKTNCGDFLKLDLHFLSVWQAKEKIRQHLKIAKEFRLSGLYLIHGFNNGNKIKTYIRGGSLENSLRDRGIKSNILPVKGNPGTSGILFLPSNEYCLSEI